MTEKNVIMTDIVRIVPTINAVIALMRWKEKRMDEMTLTLNSPITEEQWDAIVDVDFDHTDSITFYTKHGKEVEFVKRKKGKWIIRNVEDRMGRPTGKHFCKCDQCGEEEILSFRRRPFDYCPNCGADMRGTPS